MAEDKSSMTGLTEDEAMEFHKFYQQGLILFVGIGVVAHFLVWMWRPWIPYDHGYGAKVSSILSSLPLIG